MSAVQPLFRGVFSVLSLFLLAPVARAEGAPAAVASVGRGEGVPAARGGEDGASSGSDVPGAPGPRLVVKYDWTLTVTGGGGGAVGWQFDRWEVGVMGFATPLSGSFRDSFLKGAGGHDVKLNWGAEVYAQWYPAISRRWLFVGGVLSLDGFRLEEQGTGARGQIHAFYAAPRVGLHVPLGVDWVFFEPSVGAAIRLRDGSSGEGVGGVGARAVAPLTFLSVGGAIPL